ncbi:MAG: hypothetical protein ABIB93_05990 [Chloroflexota bacterium]
MLYLKIPEKPGASLDHESGIALLETLVALVILGMIAAGFLGGLSTAIRADMIITEQSDAESIARSQMEHIKKQGYIDFAAPGHESYDLITISSDYTLEVTVTPLDPATGQPLESGQDYNLQKITATVERDGKELTTLEGYKVNR